MPATQASPRPAPRAALAAAFAALYVFWGSTYLGSKFAMESLPPYLLGGIRFIIAGLAMAGLLLATRTLRPSDFASVRWWRNCGAAGLLFFAVANGLVSVSVQRIPSGLAALVVALTSVWIVAFDRMITRAGRPSPAITAGLACGVVGVAVLGGPSWSGPAGELDPVGLLLVTLSTVAWALGTMVAKHTDRPPSLWAASVMQMLVGGVGMLVLSLAFERTRWPAWDAVTPGSLWAVAYLVTFGSLIGFSAYMWLLQHASAAAVATYAYVNPLVALGLGAALADERVPPRTVPAAALILGSVALIQFVRPPPRDEPPVEEE
jgi:drug/metabolite transporter (DMT)-like permease